MQCNAMQYNTIHIHIPHIISPNVTIIDALHIILIKVCIIQKIEGDNT